MATGKRRIHPKHTPAICSKDSEVVIPQTQDLTDTRVIERDFNKQI